MKIQLVYDRPANISTDLLVVVHDSDVRLHDLTGSPLDEMVRRIGRDLSEKRRKREYFTSVNSGSGAQNIVIFSTALSPSYNLWENLKIFVARSVHLAKDQALKRVCVLLNTDEAAPFIGK